MALHNVKTSCETVCADHSAAKDFPTQLKIIIEEKAYTKEKIFNVDKTGLFWTRQSSQTYNSKEEKTAPGFLVVKDCITFLVCSNAAGDCMIKPMLNPQVFKGICKGSLPVFLGQIKNLGSPLSCFRTCLKTVLSQKFSLTSRKKIEQQSSFDHLQCTRPSKKHLAGKFRH